MNEPASISIIIPVLREGDRINNFIGQLRTLFADIEPEIIVVDGDPAGATIKQIDDRNIIAGQARQGRANQMNHGASLATGDILIFLHADTLLPPNAFGLIRNALTDTRFVGGCFNLGIDSPRWYFRITEHYVALRTRITRVPFGDQSLFIRRAYFEKIGGFRDIPLMEDVEIMTRIRKRGARICIIRAKVMTSARRWEKEGVLYATFRNWLFQIMYCLGVTPERLSKLYRS